MKVRYVRARHGTAWRVHVEGKEDYFGWVMRFPKEGWAFQTDPTDPWVPGFANRVDATVGLLLLWGGRGGAPKSRAIYEWVQQQGRGG